MMEMTADLVVIGAGGAGLPAALAALDAGLSRAAVTGLVGSGTTGVTAVLADARRTTWPLPRSPLLDAVL